MVTTMITRIGKSNKEVSAYTLINENYETKTVKVSALAKILATDKSGVTNLALKDGKIVSTNGALDNYTLIDTDEQPGNAIKNTPRAVILNRAEQNGKLIGYTVYMTNGAIAELSVAQAVELVNKKLVANGKIKHTQSGDIVSSIGGEYPLRVIKVAEAPKAEIVCKPMLFNKVSNIECFGIVVKSTSAVQMTAINKVLEAANKSLVAKIEKAGLEKEAYENQRVSATGVYAVIEEKEAAKIFGKTRVDFGGMVVSVIDKSGEEIVVSVNSDKTIGKVLTKSDEAKVNAVKKVAEKVVTLFN